MSKRKLIPEKVHFRETPEWQSQVRSVLNLKKRGFDESQICSLTDIVQTTVKRIIEEDEINNLIIKESWDKKVPVMRDIVGMGLDGIKETLKEMMDPEIRQKMIRNIADLGALTKIVESLNMLLRLEEGKSTQNIATAHTYKETRVALQELSKIDPVFDYKTEALPPVKID